ncbi:MAG: tyrosine--tRNA ligase [Nitrospirae bacterium]|nr:tyrosine--tRNA ligase [Nitrospirota bacterium]
MPTEMRFLRDLEIRGLINQKTPDITDLRLQETRSPLYVGFDPSAPSLHAGSLIPLLSMDRYRRQGGQVITLFGGATGLIGDPSGKDEERQLESEETVRERVNSLQNQVREFFQRTDGPQPIFCNNINWYQGMALLTFLRDIGKSFSVNQMLARESIRSRIEDRSQGISYTEFSYALLQAYDYLYLFEHHGCRLQMGASDQWGNICSGIDLIRRNHAVSVDGLTLPLLTNAAGKKYGKSEKGAVWLDPNMTTPFHFYQFWLGTDDKDVERFLMWLTDYSIDEIRAWATTFSSETRELQRRLALWLTARVHGEAVADMARRASEAMFYGTVEQLDAEVVEMLIKAVPSLRLDRNKEALAVDVLIKLGGAKSKGEVRRLIAQGGLSANSTTISDALTDLRKFSKNGSAVIVSKGKSSKFLIVFE